VSTSPDRHLPAQYEETPAAAGTTDPLIGEQTAEYESPPASNVVMTGARRTAARHVTRPRVTGIARQSDRR
jgi:hypothetical protein